MKETNLKLAQKDIEDALNAIENLEKSLNENGFSKEILKNNFFILAEKMEKLESILKQEGIL